MQSKTKENRTMLDELALLGALLDKHYKLRGYEGYRDFQSKEVLNDKCR